jgi:hypothetical protein
MKLVKTILIGSLSVSAIAMATLTFSMGLDDNSLNDSFDGALETKQYEDEESSFSLVANTIIDFVLGQYATRKDKLHLDNPNPDEEHKLIYGDLPKNHYATRDVHRKTNGCFKAKLNISKSLLNDINVSIGTIISDRSKETDIERKLRGKLPEMISAESGTDELGVFQPGSTYDAIVRYSNGHPKNNHDRIPDARGFAVKILQPNTISSGSLAEQSSEQFNKDTLLDILSINFPTFFVNERQSAKKYLAINEYFLDGAYDFGGKIQEKVKTLESVFNVGMSAQEIIAALSVNGSVIKSAMFQEYFSMVPSRLGTAGAARAVKYFWTPVACTNASKTQFAELMKTELPSWAKERSYQNPKRTLDLPPYTSAAKKWWFSLPESEADYPHDYLRRNIEKNLKGDAFCYELYLQPYRDMISTNIEDSSDVWLKDETQRTDWLKLMNTLDNKLIWASKFNYFAYTDYLKTINQKFSVKPIKAATLTINKIEQDEMVENSAVCEDLSFNPWNGNIAYHKPLGVVSRMKRRVYNASRITRHIMNEIKTEDLQRKN